MEVRDLGMLKAYNNNLIRTESKGGAYQSDESVSCALLYVRRSTRHDSGSTYVLTELILCALMSIKSAILFVHCKPQSTCEFKEKKKEGRVRAMVTPNRQSHVVALPNGNTERHGIWCVLSLSERVNLAGQLVKQPAPLPLPT